ncbi:hypothetical protein [Saccharothrix carnea]|uniref:hypothetical protein n=1 Tax=Saccharothrix carnea TaxID=1280637 RepID=UPI0011B26CD5|nr:hypothetical protein [Saccharothrix carnea]
MLVGLVLPLWEDGPPLDVTLPLVIAGLLLKAREAHAERPGAWFPLLVTGATAFALTSAGGFVDGWWLSVGPTAFDLWQFLFGLVVAIGLGIWAWRARSYVVAVTALGYLAAVWYFRQEPVEEFGWFAYAPLTTLTPVVPTFDFLPHPELVVVAGAVLAHTRVDRVRPWHVVAILGLLGSLWHYSALALVVAAVVVAAYDLSARRPGAWYPLLLVGIGLVVWPVVDRVFLAPELPAVLANAPGGRNESGGIEGAAIAVAVGPWTGYDELFLAFVVAIGPAVWSWRRRSPIVLLTAVVYLGLTWLRTGPVPTELVVLAGAAVAFATAAPGATRTAGRSAGTPDRPPGP